MNKAIKFDIHTFRNNQNYQERFIKSSLSIDWDYNVEQPLNIVGHTDFVSNKALDKVYIDLFPTKNSYDVLAQLHYGN